MARRPGRLHGYRIDALPVVQTRRNFDYDVENGWYGVRLMGPARFILCSHIESVGRPANETDEEVG